MTLETGEGKHLHCKDDLENVDPDSFEGTNQPGTPDITMIITYLMLTIQARGTLCARKWELARGPLPKPSHMSEGYVPVGASHPRARVANFCTYWRPFNERAKRIFFTFQGIDRIWGGLARFTVRKGLAECMVVETASVMLWSF